MRVAFFIFDSRNAAFRLYLQQVCAIEPDAQQVFVLLF